jgi:hypothetical protein
MYFGANITPLKGSGRISATITANAPYVTHLLFYLEEQCGTRSLSMGLAKRPLAPEKKFHWLLSPRQLP